MRYNLATRNFIQFAIFVQFVQQESLAFLSLHVALLVLGARETSLQNREFALVVGLCASVSRFAL